MQLHSSVFVTIRHVASAGVPIENILYLGGPNIASEIYNKEYANARICGSEKWRLPLAKFLRQPQFIVWDNSDLITHEVMGGLKNVYAIGAGNLFRSFLFKFEIMIYTFSIRKVFIFLSRNIGCLLLLLRHGGGSDQRECYGQISVFCTLHIGDDLHHTLAN